MSEHVSDLNNAAKTDGADSVRRQESERDRLKRYIRLRGSLDDRLIFHWLRARRSAVSGQQIVPLCNMLAGIVSRYALKPDGSYDMTVYEITFYTDLETGEVLRELKMPFTGKNVKPPLYRMGPEKYVGKLRHGEQGQWTPQIYGEEHEEVAAQMSPAGDFDFEFSISPEVRSGKDLWIRSDYTYQLIPKGESMSPKFYKESVVWHADAAAAESGQSAPASYAYAGATTWRPWMEMGDIEGHTLSDGTGGKVWRAEDLPQDFLSLVDKFHPGLLEDPSALMS